MVYETKSNLVIMMVSFLNAVVFSTGSTSAQPWSGPGTNSTGGVPWCRI